mmetsp:Transcript_8390/g.29820  ORF Transcript_8390/g.29820 Transcript_8390/m.29820 type:complete len:249 (-) Transcript_8390:1406-2152(-)
MATARGSRASGMGFAGRMCAAPVSGNACTRATMCVRQLAYVRRRPYFLRALVGVAPPLPPPAPPRLAPRLLLALPRRLLSADGDDDADPDAAARSASVTVSECFRRTCRSRSPSVSNDSKAFDAMRNPWPYTGSRFSFMRLIQKSASAAPLERKCVRYMCFHSSHRPSTTTSSSAIGNSRRLSSAWHSSCASTARICVMGSPYTTAIARTVVSRVIRLSRLFLVDIAVTCVPPGVREPAASPSASFPP